MLRIFTAGLLFAFWAGVARAQPSQAIEGSVKDYTPGATDLVPDAFPRSGYSSGGESTTTTSTVTDGPFSVSALAQNKALPINLNEPLSKVVLKDGSVLHHVKIVSFGNSTVMAKWDEGRGTIPYETLPDDVRKAAERRRPVPSESPVSAGESDKAEVKAEAQTTSALVSARRGFQTYLLRHESTGDAPDQPPSGVLNLVSYPGPLGAMAAYVSPPPGDGKRHPAIIWLVGGSSNSISSLAWTPGPSENDQSATAFRDFGIVMMYPSLRGGNNNPGYHERFFGEVDDVIAAARFLARLNYVDPHRIYLGGHSTGGTLALLVAESSDLFRAVYALGAVGDMSGYGQDKVPFDISNVRECQLRSPKLWLDSIHVPTFVFEGEEPPCNIGPWREMAGLNRNALIQFHSVPGGTHFTIIAPLVREIAAQIQKDDAQP
jgi:pimeloyl-ACP methyl ester carboxylesterase